jgi:anthranilate/para-aminobenzoate synthase component I
MTEALEREIALSEDEAMRRLARHPGAFRLCDDGRVFLGALPVARSGAIDPAENEAATAHTLERDYPRWVGVLPYESFRMWERRSTEEAREEPHISSAIWQCYDAVVEVKGEQLILRGSSPEAVERLHRALVDEQEEAADGRAELSWAAAPEAGELHEARVRSALERIAAGQLYQVNLARRFHFRVKGDPLALLSSLGPLARAPFAAAMDLGEVQVVSTSPELFLEHSPGGHVVTRPIKGTRPRSGDSLEDARLRTELDQSEKEQAELAMVIDIERNDLGRLSEPGTVKMTEAPHVVSHPTVHHREATIEAQLRSGVTRRELIETMMPSGSVTGAPKVAAMDLIAELETERRGLYTGALGYISQGGRLRLSMAIRVLTMKGGDAHYYTGGGIVADSDPAQELQETIWKAEQLQALVNVSRPPT